MQPAAQPPHSPKAVLGDGVAHQAQAGQLAELAKHSGDLVLAPLQREAPADSEAEFGSVSGRCTGLAAVRGRPRRRRTRREEGTALNPAQASPRCSPATNLTKMFGCELDEAARPAASEFRAAAVEAVLRAALRGSCGLLVGLLAPERAPGDPAAASIAPQAAALESARHRAASACGVVAAFPGMAWPAYGR